MSHATDRPDARLVRKLHAWELDHLRGHVEELHQRLDEALARIGELSRQLSWAEECAAMWQRAAEQALEAEDSGEACSLGMAPAGDLVLVCDEQLAPQTH